MSENNQKPIFIIGCERSGTTLIRLILHSHPNIALPPQTKFLKKIYKRRLQWRNLANEANRIKLSHWFTDHFDNHTKLPDLGLEARDIHKEIVSSATSLGAAAKQARRPLNQQAGVRGACCAAAPCLSRQPRCCARARRSSESTAL